jgi:hypothetical protein
MKWTTLKFIEILEENIFQYRVTSGESRAKLIARVKAEIRESAKQSGDPLPENLTAVLVILLLLKLMLKLEPNARKSKIGFTTTCMSRGRIQTRKMTMSPLDSRNGL